MRNPIDEDLPFQRRLWLVQRVGWCLIGLFLLAGLGGVFGGVGPLSTHKSRAGQVIVEHPRFARYVAPVEVRVSLDRPQAGPLELSIERRYIDTFEMYDISPEPASVRASETSLIYAFEPLAARAEVVFFGRAHHVGTLRGSLSVDGGPPLPLRTFVFP